MSSCAQKRAVSVACLMILTSICGLSTTSSTFGGGIGQTDAGDAIAEQVDTILAEAFAGDEPGAAVIVLHEGHEVLRKGYGMADIELGVPVRPEMVFRIGSVTKQFTAAAAMKLVERGEISLEDSLRMFIPRLPGRFGPVRVKHLLSNTSGIPDYMQSEEFDQLVETDYHYIVNEELDLDKILEIIAESDLTHEPGARYSYSNSNYFLLATIIEEVSGGPYFEFLKREILDPAGMVNTYYMAGATFVPGRVPVHLEFEGQIIKSPHRCMGSTMGFGCGGLWSNVDDMARYVRALEGGELVTAETLAEMSAPYILADGSPSRYGLGWQTARLRGRDMVFHGGDYLGYSALILWIPSFDIFVAILSNDGRIHAFNLDYPARKVAALLFGDPFPEWEAVEMGREDLHKYVGTYRISENNVREFIVEDGRAYTRRNGRSMLEVYPASDSTFFYTVTLSYIEFEFDEEGVPVRMIMHRDTGDDETAERMN